MVRKLKSAIADMRKERPTVVPFGDDGARGFLHPPATSRGEGMVLTHGAGGNRNAPLLVATNEPPRLKAPRATALMTRNFLNGPFLVDFQL
jgi:hypothetical protein